MNKMIPETRAKHAVRLIYAGATWDEVTEFCNVHKTQIQRDLHKHYAKSGGKDSSYYKALLKLQRENAKLRENAKQNETTNNDIHIIESGFIVTVGMPGVKALLKKAPTVVLPLFCEGELRNLSKSYTAAEDFLKSKGTENIPCIFLNPKEETLLVEPNYEVAPRVKAIVAFACEFATLGFNVHLYTNSRRIEALANMQDADIVVDVL